MGLLRETIVATQRPQLGTISATYGSPDWVRDLLGIAYVLNMPRTLLGPLALSLVFAIQIVAAPVSAGRGPRVTKASKGTKVRASRGSVKRTFTKRSATTALHFRGKKKAKSNAPSTALKPKIAAPKTKTSAKPKAAKSPDKKRKATTPKALGSKRNVAKKTKVLASKRNVAKKTKVESKQKAIAKSQVSKWQKSLKAVKAGIATIKASPRVSRLIKFATKTSKKITRRLDAWQARAPPWLANSMSALRTYTFASVAAYTFARLKTDKAFLGTYVVASAIASYLVLPSSVALGLDPVVATVLNVLTTPLSMAVVVLRERHNRAKAGETISLKETSKLIGREYRDFAQDRRAAASKAAHAAAPLPAL